MNEIENFSFTKKNSRFVIQNFIYKLECYGKAEKHILFILSTDGNSLHQEALQYP